MEVVLDDLNVELETDPNFGNGARVIRVDLNGKLNFEAFKLNGQFGFNSQTIGWAKVDPAGGRGAIISLRRDITISNPLDELSVSYNASAQNGDQAMGRIVIQNVEFEIGAAPVTFELDACCSLPDKIVIDVRDYNGALPVSLTSVGDNNSDAATVTVTDVTGSDYNDDYNDDFGMDPNKIITYELNKTTDFWKTLNALDKFQYNVSYKGKTASNFITVKLK